MASTVETPNSQQYVDFDEYIDYQLQKTRGNIKSTDILTAFAFIAAFVLAYLLLFVVSDHWLVTDGFSQSTRIVLLSLVGLLMPAGWRGKSCGLICGRSTACSRPKSSSNPNRNSAARF